MGYYKNRFHRFRTGAKKKRAQTIDFLMGGVYHALVDGNVECARRMFGEAANYAARKPERRMSRGRNARLLFRRLERAGFEIDWSSDKRGA